MSRFYHPPVTLVVLVGTLAAPATRAATPDELQRARQLFLQAEADEDADRWSEALDKLHAISQVRLTAGVRYHLALCEEHLGQLARALRDYRAAEEQARVDNSRDVLRTVGRELAALDQRVPRLTIRVTPVLPDIAVNLDGEPVAEALVGVAIPIDPGVHYIEVRGPDHGVSRQAVVLQEHESRTVEMTLAQPPAATPIETSIPARPPTDRVLAKPAETPPSSPPKTSHAPAMIATAISVGLAGGGVAAFLLAGGAHDRAVRECGSLASSPDACDHLKTPVRAWDFTAAGAWLGALAAGAVAVVLWTKHGEARAETGPSSARSGARTGVIIGPAPLGVGGQF
jgi:hypothetical protein